MQSEVPTYALKIAPADWDRLMANVDAKDYFVPGTFSADGRSWSVSVRLRGRHTRKFPKKSFQVRFPEEDRFRGRERIELLAQYRDAAYLTEKLWYDLAAAAGVRASRARYVDLEINGSPYGVFTELESVDKQFLRAHGFDGDADIYRCGMFDCEMKDGPRAWYQEAWTKRTNEDEPWDGLRAFLRGVNGLAPEELKAFLEERFNIEEYLTWLAVDALIANDMVMDSRSFLVFDKELRRWSYVPWDLNNAASMYQRANANNQPMPLDQSVKSYRPLWSFTVDDPWAHLHVTYRMSGTRPAWSVLSTRILEVPAYRARFLEKLEKLLSSHFTEAILGPRLEKTYALLKPHLANDPFVAQAFATRAVDYLKRYVRERRAFILQQLPALKRHGKSALRVDAVGRTAAGESYVELYNASASPADLAGLYVTGDLRAPTQASPPAQTLPPGGRVRVSISTPAASAEAGLYASDGRTPIDWVMAGALEPGGAVMRTPSGAEAFSQ